MTNEQMPASPAYSPPLQGAYQLLAALPALWLTLLALFTLAVTVQQGHVPFYGHPDPKDTGLLLVFYYPVLLLLPFVLASLPVSFLLTLFTFWARFPFAPRWGATILYLLGLVLFLLLIPGDPFGLVAWLVD